jgi:DNA-binding HxlR family transcriptional regulator
MRFNEFRRMIPDATHKVLTQQLRDLERAGIITRKIYPEVPPKVEYSLSANGQTLRPVLAAMATWGQKYRQQHPVELKPWKRPSPMGVTGSKNNRRTTHA